ncbi:MAG: hypothetical protein R8J94_05365 [Acidimicrobiia bacterium]|nr:hypothetical protein [Acidimicrobiia bacterium]
MPFTPPDSDECQRYVVSTAADLVVTLDDQTVVTTGGQDERSHRSWTY